MQQNLTAAELHSTTEYKAVFSAVFAMLNCQKPKGRKKAIKAIWSYLQGAEGVSAPAGIEFSRICLREALTVCEKFMR